MTPADGDIRDPRRTATRDRRSGEAGSAGAPGAVRRRRPARAAVRWRRRSGARSQPDADAQVELRAEREAGVVDEAAAQGVAQVDLDADAAELDADAGGDD